MKSAMNNRFVNKVSVNKVSVNQVRVNSDIPSRRNTGAGIPDSGETEYLILDKSKLDEAKLK